MMMDVQFVHSKPDYASAARISGLREFVLLQRFNSVPLWRQSRPRLLYERERIRNRGGNLIATCPSIREPLQIGRKLYGSRKTCHG